MPDTGEPSEWYPQRIASELMDSGSLDEMLRWALGPGSHYAGHIADLIFEQRRIRLKFFRSRPKERRADWSRSIVRSSRGPLVGFLADLLRDFHFAQRKVLMTAFLDCCGITHDGCNVAEETVLDRDKAVDCVNRLDDEYGLSPILTYLSTAGWFSEHWRPALWQIVDARHSLILLSEIPVAHGDPIPEAENAASGHNFTVLILLCHRMSLVITGAREEFEHL